MKKEVETEGIIDADFNDVEIKTTKELTLYEPGKLDNLRKLNLVKPEDIQFMCDHADQFQDRFAKRSFFRSEFEMRYGVLSESEHPTPDSKYW